MAQRFGGAFAPPLSQEILDTYASLFGLVADTIQKESLICMLSCVQNWYALPESEGTLAKPHPCGVGTIIPLANDIKNQLALTLPSGPQILIYEAVAESITETVLRNAAFHVLWHVKELALGREPITFDKLNLPAQP